MKSSADYLRFNRTASSAALVGARFDLQAGVSTEMIPYRWIHRSFSFQS